uniref:Fadd protein n=1 Tax=Leguminivora glycinivorella TaxID=1035111 RepID=A0A346RAD6_9NEOP|nr:fadd protein [Leguminivora glycinivorella]
MVRVEVRPIHATQCRTMATNYSKLKDLITLKVSMSDMHSQILHAMKGLYQNDINSARRYEQITTIGQLLKVLEVRDVLSEENILPLQVLAQRLPDNMEIMNSISCYEQSRGPKQNINQYAPSLSDPVWRSMSNIQRMAYCAWCVAHGLWRITCGICRVAYRIWRVMYWTWRVCYVLWRITYFLWNILTRVLNASHHHQNNMRIMHSQMVYVRRNVKG